MDARMPCGKKRKSESRYEIAGYGMRLRTNGQAVKKWAGYRGLIPGQSACGQAALTPGRFACLGLIACRSQLSPSRQLVLSSFVLPQTAHSGCSEWPAPHRQAPSASCTDPPCAYLHPQPCPQRSWAVPSPCKVRCGARFICHWGCGVGPFSQPNDWWSGKLANAYCYTGHLPPSTHWPRA